MSGLPRRRSATLAWPMLLGAFVLDATAQSAWPYPAGAQPQAVRLAADEAPPRIDGRLDEPVWQRAPVHDVFVQYLPVDKRAPPAGYRTTVQIAVDDGGLTFAIRAFDPQPARIVAPLTRRDRVLRDQDFVAVMLDAAGTRRSAQFVRVNAAGVIGDGMFIADTDTEDFSPDFDVDAAASRLADGYSVELRLPLLALRYPHAGGAPWRLMVTRSIPRESSILLLSAPLTKDALNFIAELQPVAGLDDVAERARGRSLLALRPEITARAKRTDPAGTRRRNVAFGAELKWRPRADWVFDATLNPDFSQVELDVPQLAGNTRFALSVPEKRAFFLESTDVLDLPIEAFYSRAVTDPRAGLRATWRGVHGDATGLTLRDDGGGLILLPGPYGTGEVPQLGRSQATLVRARAHRESLSAGAMLSSRDYAGGGHNRVAGADLVWRADDEQLFVLRALGSHTTARFDDDGTATVGTAEHGHQLALEWEQQVPGWTFSADLLETSPRFRNDNGFVEQAGVRGFEAEVIRRFGEAQLPGFTAHEFELFFAVEHWQTLADARAGIAGGETIARRLHPGIWLAAARDTQAWLQLRFDAERADSGHALHPVRTIAAGWGLNPAPWFTRLLVELEAGERLDIEADRVGRGAVWLVDAKLRAALANGWGLESEQRVAQGFVDGDGGERWLTDTALQWLGVLHLSSRDSLRVVWQQTRYRHAPVPGVLPDGDSLRETTSSLVAQRRFGVGRSVSVGLSRHSERPGALRETELFAKLSFEWGR